MFSPFDELFITFVRLVQWPCATLSLKRGNDDNLKFVYVYLTVVISLILFIFIYFYFPVCEKGHRVPRRKTEVNL